MDDRLFFHEYLLIGSLLFGMFFGAGNLIFPVHMGQEAGAMVYLANYGFLITGVGLPFLAVVAMGISGCKNLQSLAGRVSSLYGKLFTVALYLSIGPGIALPRTGTVSYEVGMASSVAPEMQQIGLALFTGAFFLVALGFSLKPNKILVWVGKLLNPLFLLFLAVLIITALFAPMGDVANMAVNGAYKTQAFSKGFIEGYNTLDALAGLAFAIIVIRTLENMGQRTPKAIALGTLKAGVVSVVLMCLIYTALAWLGASSMGKLTLAANGGVAWAQIAQYYFGHFGALLLGAIVTLACLKTAIGLITSCSATFVELFPHSVSYKAYVYIFTIASFLVANLGLNKIIMLSVPVLMFIYPLAMTLIIVTFLTVVCKNRELYVVTTIFTGIAAFGDMLASLPKSVQAAGWIQSLLGVYQHLPLFSLGMGWLVPAIIGLAISFLFRKKENVA